MSNDNEMFDADAFLTSTTADAMSTRMEPIPEGEYRAAVKEVLKPRKIQPNDPTKPAFVMMDVLWAIDDVALATKLGRATLTVKQGLMLDVVNGKLDTSKGKNIGLGRLREALNQNDSNKPWSPGMLNGAGPVLVKVTHRQDKNNPEVIYDEVRTVTKIS